MKFVRKAKEVPKAPRTIHVEGRKDGVWELGTWYTQLIEGLGSVMPLLSGYEA